MPRPFRVLLTTALSVAALAGCTAQPDGSTAPSSSASSPVGPASSAPASSAPPVPAPSGSPSTAAETRYVTAVQQLSPTLATVDPAILIALGHDVCRSFAAGKTAQQVAESFGAQGEIPGFSGGEAAIIIGTAVPTLCPQYRDRLDG